MTIRKIWQIKQCDIDEKQLKLCGNNKVLAVLLKNRGIETEAQIKSFLNPLNSSLSSPDVFVDMQKTSDRIKSAIEKKEHITVYGDFDADGVTSTALLYLTLKHIGADVGYYLPDRETESHGLNTKALVKIISKQKSKLIITVDCGISNNNEVKFAKGFNTDIIITDHHEAPEILPEAFSILNPKAQEALRPDLDIDELKSLNCLAGVGVAFKLACKLLSEYNCEEFVHEILPLSAVGTIGDVVDLIGENRILVSMGIELLKNGKHKGLQKIITAMGCNEINNLTSENIAFGIVPRLNAAGRLESPSTAINVLISDDEETLNDSVKTLNDLNVLRQELCEETFLQAKEMYEKNKNSFKNSIILFHNNWHIGIIGIVASKLVESYNKPVFLMTKDANNTNIIRCSCRSIPQINIYEILSKHKDIFEGFGGHKMAAGFSFDENKITFESFKKLLSTTINEECIDIDFSKSVIIADMLVSPDDITVETINCINKLQPFGAKNPNPLFVINNLKLKQFKMMGQNNNHLKLFVSDDNNTILECVKWNIKNFNLPEGANIDILFSPKLNTFNGNTSIQYVLEDFHSDCIDEKAENTELKLLDHRNKKDILNQVLDYISSTKKKTNIYIESSKLKKQISVCEKASNIITDINNIQQDCEQIMFFECPASKEDFIKIVNNSNASIIHLMNFNITDIIPDNFISTLSGMLKYAISNLNGKFETQKLSQALAVSEELIELTLNLFDETGMIDLLELSDKEYKITYLKPLELSKIKQNELFNTLENLIEEINEFRHFYLNATIEEIKNIL